jgi:hypothetical protein
MYQPEMNNFNTGAQMAGNDNGFNGYNVGAQFGEATVIIGETEDNPACLELLDSSRPGAIQRISLEFQGNYITIGRKSADTVQASVCFSSEFKQISRMHARIDREGNNYRLIDLGSANRTMVNNDVLIPNNPYILKNGDKITFAVNSPVIYRVVM